MNCTPGISGTPAATFRFRQRLQVVVPFADVISMTGNRLHYLTADDWILIQAKAVRRTFRLGDEIIRQGEWGDSIYIIRRGEASVELAGTGSRAIIASLGPEDICGDMAFLERGKATAVVVAKDQEVEVDQINAHELRNILEAFPRLASRFYRSVAVVLVQRLKTTTAELAREMTLRDRREEHILSGLPRIKLLVDES